MWLTVIILFNIHFKPFLTVFFKIGTCFILFKLKSSGFFVGKIHSFLTKLLLSNICKTILWKPHHLDRFPSCHFLAFGYCYRSLDRIKTDVFDWHKLYWTSVSTISVKCDKLFLAKQFTINQEELSQQRMLWCSKIQICMEAKYTKSVCNVSSYCLNIPTLTSWHCIY